MPETPYDPGAPGVNGNRPEPDAAARERRRVILDGLGLITTEDLLDGLNCSKATLAKYRANGLKALGVGKQKVYEKDQVKAVLKALAEADTDDGREAGGGEA